MADEGVELFGEYENQTDMAELWNLEDYGRTWIPKSQIKESDSAAVVVTTWYAQKLENENE